MTFGSLKSEAQVGGSDSGCDAAHRSGVSIKLFLLPIRDGLGSHGPVVWRLTNSFNLNDNRDGCVPEWRDCVLGDDADFSVVARVLH
jgi:hypothetical protein